MSEDAKVQFAKESNPEWKKYGRSGPFDWWLGCRLHGSTRVDSCLSCVGSAIHNAEFAKKLAIEEGTP